MLIVFSSLSDLQQALQAKPFIMMGSITTQSVCAVYSCVNNRCHLSLPLTVHPIVSSLCAWLCSTHTHIHMHAHNVPAQSLPSALLVTPHLPSSSPSPHCSSLISPLFSPPFFSFPWLTTLLSPLFPIHGTPPEHKQDAFQKNGPSLPHHTLQFSHLILSSWSKDNEGKSGDNEWNFWC